jgi:hypothetical protein
MRCDVLRAVSRAEILLKRMISLGRVDDRKRYIQQKRSCMSMD